MFYYQQNNDRKRKNIINLQRKRENLKIHYHPAGNKNEIVNVDTIRFYI